MRQGLANHLDRERFRLASTSAALSGHPLVLVQDECKLTLRYLNCDNFAGKVAGPAVEPFIPDAAPDVEVATGHADRGSD